MDTPTITPELALAMYRPLVETSAQAAPILLVGCDLVGPPLLVQIEGAPGYSFQESLRIFVASMVTALGRPAQWALLSNEGWAHDGQGGPQVEVAVFCFLSEESRWSTTVPFTRTLEGVTWGEIEPIVNPEGGIPDALDGLFQ